MKKANSKFAAFIDEKYLPLDNKLKIGIEATIILIPIIIFFLFPFQSNNEKIEKLEKQNAQLTKEINDLKKKERELPKLLAEVKKVEEVFEEAALMLPKDKEIPKLLKDVSSLGRNAGLEFLSFIPRPEVQKNFYNEVPVDITIDGTYHSMGFFFDQVSKLGRIVSISNVSMGSPKSEQGEILLNSKCQIKTYRFTNKELVQNKK